MNPYVDGGPWVGESLVMRGGELSPLEGPLAPLVVERTFSMSDGTGLAIARDGAGGTRAFHVRERGYEELRSWSGLRVVDIAPLGTGHGYLLLAGEAGEPERFALHRFQASEPAALERVRGLDCEAPTAVAWFEGALFVGTADGRVLRARTVD